LAEETSMTGGIPATRVKYMPNFLTAKH